jgi:hypothetical protein
MSTSSLRVHVALKIDAHGDGRTTLAGLAAPDAVVIFFQVGDFGVARLLDFRFGLALSEAITSSDRCVGIVLAGAIYGVVIWPGFGRWILCRCRSRGNQASTNEKKGAFHWFLQKVSELVNRSGRIRFRSRGLRRSRGRLITGMLRLGSRAVA